MIEIEKSIASLEKAKSLLNTVNDEIFSVYLYRPCYDLERKYSITIELLRKIKNKDIDLTKKYQIGELTFEFEFHIEKLRLSVGYSDKLGVDIYNSYSGSWSTQYDELQKWFNRIVVDDLEFPLGTNDLEVDTDKLYLYTDDYLNNTVNRIQKAIYQLSNPSSRLKFVIDNYIAYIRKKIEWYNEDEDNGCCADIEENFLLDK